MNLEPQWIVGFVDGEGCFFVGFNKQSTMKIKIQVLPEFTVVQHQRDIAVLQNLKTYFQCGVVQRNHSDRYAYRVRGHENLLKKIIPFFEKHKLKTKKRVDFEKFRDIVLLMEKKADLQFEGLEKITKIANTMNTKGVSVTSNTKWREEQIHSNKA
uniref:Putative LAGLIDADG homing endonuclease n=1 Tax=Pleurastrosarcina brevispinosa TaxID=163096 RepID=A0A097KN94_9CHLO|nr:putative LAGLIDADG homing endonuclease [Chlorosarcina brevispinosa]AIT94647.1 putative LAGLIDADG homing endonuclease [Chlorosarcina brevispinosa]